MSPGLDLATSALATPDAELTCETLYRDLIWHLAVAAAAAMQKAAVVSLTVCEGREPHGSDRRGFFDSQGKE